MATVREIRNVQRVLASRNRQITDHLVSIDTLLTGSGRAKVPTPGLAGYRELVKRFDAVARELLTISRGLEAVDFDSRDKTALKTALRKAAGTWTERARIWRAGNKAEIDEALRRMKERGTQAKENAEAAREYFNDL